MKKRSFDFALAAIGVLMVSAYALSWRMASDWKNEETPAAGNGLAQAAVAPAPVASALLAGANPLQDKTYGPSQEDWQEMTESLQRLAGRYSGQVAIDLEDLDSGRRWTYHEDDLFPAASIIKVPIMACVFEAVKEGKIALNQTLVLHRKDRIGGSGTLKWLPDGTKLTVQELLNHMIRESDNVAATMLLDAVGYSFVQAELPRLGLAYTTISPEGMMTLRSGYIPHDNYTTAREISMLMDKIYRGELIDADSSRMMLSILEEKKEAASRLEKGLPRNWTIAHKTGLERRACHDSAIFFTPEGNYLLTVLTGHNSNYHSAKNFITRLGHITFVYYGGYPRYYARLWSQRRSILFR